ncbi:MAG: gamma-glutamyltranspeptidase [Chloroflexota bacterium]|nr:MAG: gamma-glutamyltranspeptidase [Chloroflexota bacterium]
MPPPRPLVPAFLARGARGAVVAPHHLAAEAGLGVLRAGGSAVDAAVATNAALAVVAPNACGLGGDAFWLIWDEANRTLLALNGSGRAPAGLEPAALRAQGLDRLPLRGPLTITVPGAVRSWADAHARFGRLSLPSILDPAIELAADGFPAWDGFIASVEATAELLPRAGVDPTGWAAVFRPAGRPWRAGERVRLPALATTIGHLATVGLDDFYLGELAERQVAALAAAGSPIRLDDFRNHTSTWSSPITVDYRGVTVASHPPNSSGVVALEILGLLARFEPPAPDAFGPDGPTDPHWVHLGIEASKLAFADRDAHLTDPEAMTVDAAWFVDPGRLADLAAAIDHRRSRVPAAARNPAGGGTVFFAAVDADGNAVSCIESHYMGFGSGIADPATGIHYQNRGAYFSLEPAHPNVLAPRKRTLHTLLPWMLLRDGRPWIVGGSMGGDAQPQICAQLVSAIVDGGLDVAGAVALPRWFVEPEAHFEPPVEVRIEPRFGGAVVEALRARGHPVTPVAPFDALLGHAHAIELVDGGPARGGTLAAATDPRSAGLPAVW